MSSKADTKLRIQCNRYFGVWIGISNDTTGAVNNCLCLWVSAWRILANNKGLLHGSERTSSTHSPHFTNTSNCFISKRTSTTSKELSAGNVLCFSICTELIGFTYLRIEPSVVLTYKCSTNTCISLLFVLKILFKSIYCRRSFAIDG